MCVCVLLTAESNTGRLGSYSQPDVILFGSPIAGWGGAGAGADGPRRGPEPSTSPPEPPSPRPAAPGPQERVAHLSGWHVGLPFSTDCKQESLSPARNGGGRDAEPDGAESPPLFPLVPSQCAFTKVRPCTAALAGARASPPLPARAPPLPSPPLPIPGPDRAPPPASFVPPLHSCCPAGRSSTSCTSALAGMQSWNRTACAMSRGVSAS